MKELFEEVCDWKDNTCRNSRLKGQDFACCSRHVCPRLCPLKIVFPNKCDNPPALCKFFLCNTAKIYIMEHSHLHEKYTELLKEQSEIGIEYNTAS